MSATSIVTSRDLTIEHLGGSAEWRVTEFLGDRYMLVVDATGTGFHAHFTGEQWTEFQKLIVGLS